eukprot:m.135371 g.135371  ORF g.135371 m.135371 type:complete len:278 (+) comp22591_c0_seq1:351-1184(+)
MPPSHATTGSGGIDPWDDGFVLGSRACGSASGRSRSRQTPSSAPHHKAVSRRPTTATHSSRPSVVGNVTLAGGWSGDYGQTCTSRPSTAPAGYKRDFAKLNKAALKHGLVTAKEQMKFREVNPGFVKAHTATGRRPRDQAPRFGADHVFGAATPNPEPIDTVISLQAGREWYEIRHAQMLAQRGREELHAKQYKIGQPLTTRTVMLRRKDPSRTRNDDPPPKPSKFDSRAKAAVNSFRCESDRDGAQRKHDRQAAMHQGAYFSMGIKRNVAGTSRNL